MSVGFLSHKLLARALAADPRLGLIAADRQRRISEYGLWDAAESNPIEQLRAACEQIKRSTGDGRPRSIAMHQAVYERYRQWYIESIARAERLLGIGCAAQGAFPTGWTWTKRAGRMSREEKQLRDDLPTWRLALADMPPSKPIKASNGGLLLLASADEAGDRLAVLLAGDRRGGKTGLITTLLNEAQEELSLAVSGASLIDAANKPGYGLALIDRRPLPFVAPMNPDVPAGHHDWTRAANRRPTGKRAQRRVGKEWNR